MQEIKEFTQFCEKKLFNTVNDWYDWLTLDRRMSVNTSQSYLIDLKEFFVFLQKDLGHIASLKDLKELTVSDFRAFLMEQTNIGIGRASLARHMLSLRNFFKLLKKKDILPI